MVSAAVSEPWFEAHILTISRPHRILRKFRDHFARFTNFDRCTTCAVEVVDHLGFMDAVREAENRRLGARDLDAELRFAVASMDLMESHS